MNAKPPTETAPEPRHGLRLAVFLTSLLGLFFALALHSAGNAQAHTSFAPTSPTIPNTLEWRLVPTATTYDLYDVYMTSSTNGWAVGGERNTNTSVALRYDGTTWMPVDIGTTGQLVDVYMLNATTGYILSRVGSSEGRLYYTTDGTTWTLGLTANRTLNRVSAVDADNVWVSALGRIYRGARDTWNIDLQTTYNVFSIQMLSTTDGWAAGQTGRRWHYNGTAWTEEGPPPAPQTLYDCFFRTPTEGWAIGSAIGSSYILNFDGTQWTLRASPPGFLDHIFMVSPNEGWVTGQNNLAFFDGTTVTPVNNPSPNWLLGIYMVSTTDGWIVGEQGTMLHYEEGPTPTAQPTSSPTNTSIPTSTATAAATNTQVIPTATTPATCSIQFSDVLPNNTFYSSIRCLACRGIISGYLDGTFRPNNEVTRGQLSKIVANAANFNEPVSGQTFEDVLPSNPFYQYIERMASRNVISGYPCGGPGEPCTSGKPYFRPNANATRGQISKIVSNAANYAETPTGQTFEDVSPTNTFYVWIERLASRNVMSGYPCGGPGEPCTTGKPYFRWGNNATRGQVSKIVANTFFPSCVTP